MRVAAPGGKQAAKWALEHCRMGLEWSVYGLECETRKRDFVGARTTLDHQREISGLCVEMSLFRTALRSRGEGRSSGVLVGMRGVREEGRGRRTGGRVRVARPSTSAGRECTRYWADWENFGTRRWRRIPGYNMSEG